MHDLVVIGGGIVGLATARALLRRSPVSLLLLEEEPELARHQSGRNSGVIHSGLYYRPGSLKARLCTEGREALDSFCADRGVLIRRCGKLVVATRPEQLPALEELERRAAANGLEGVERLDRQGLRRHEPAAAGIAALRVPQAGVVDFRRVAGALAAEIGERGGEIRTRARLTGAAPTADGWRLRTDGGELACRALVNCAGLFSDRIARLCGERPDLRIVPFRGEYLELPPERRHLVRALVYPVPDPRLPFLGVHLTRTIDDRVLAGPNALLAWSRRGYRRASFAPRDAWETLSWPGSWRLARRFWRTGAGEIRRSLSRRAMAAELRRLIPALEAADLRPAPPGLRAQAIDREGRLVDDFRLLEGERALHVLNAPSPAATAALAIGRHLAGLAAERLGL